MEIISEKERIDLGYAPRDPFAGVILRSQRPNSEVEFDDVFGGPPRRSSIYESRRSRADSIESFSRLSRGREDSVESHRSRLGLGEKPVFGEGSGSGRRRQLGDDFYRDIFQSSESACSSPRRGDRDALHSSPGSRVNSPNRPMALRLEPLVGGYSLPTQPSLSEKMAKGLDHPSFGSPTQCSVYRSEDELSDAFSFPSSPNASTTGFFTTQSVVGHGDLRNSGHVSSRQRPLSRLIPGSFEDLSEEMEPASQTVKSQTGKNSSSLEDYIRNQQFHFSMYKWAGKGVMLVMPSDSNEINGFEGRSTRLPEVLIQEVELPTDCDYFSRVAKAFKYEPVIQEKKSDKKEDDYIVTTAKDLSQAELGTRLLKDDTEKCGNQSEKASVPGFDENSNINSTDEKKNPEFNFNAHGEKNPELKCLGQLFEDDMDKLRSDDIRRQVNEREAQSKSQKKQQLRRESRLVPEVNRTTLHDTPPFSEDKARGNKVKGKVKEFIKKFNQEAPSKRKGAFAMLDRRSKGEGNRQDKADDLTHVSSIEAEELLAKSGNNNTPLFDILKENQVIEKAEVDKAGISYDGHMINGPPSEERIEVLHPQSGPTPEVIDNAACHEDIVHEDIAGYLVQQLPVNQTEGEQNSPQQEQIKNLDAKIRQWSRGKEGNIRSLLSTLQLVLWAESGWKQVPLVNIIEGPSVKKAYQKALLCLHPDKLQQKGASSNQKYIAEKVFDILQEAWDHFNSISEF